MTEEQFTQIQQTIKDTIKREVNGKIDKINTKLDNYIKDDEAWKVRNNDSWARAEPVIMMGENVQGFSKVSLYMLGFAAAVGGVIVLISNILKGR